MRFCRQILCLIFLNFVFDNYRIGGNFMIFKNKNFMIIWIAQFISKIGNEFHSIALMWYIMQLTGSTIQMGTSLIFSELPMIILGAFAGVIADRYDRKKIIIICDFLSGLLVAAIFILTLKKTRNVAYLYGISFLISSVSAFFSPCYSALIPAVVKEEDLPSANSASQFSSGISSILGPAAAGILIYFIGIPGLFLVNSISFILACILESFIIVPKSQKGNLTIKNFREDVKEGFLFSIKNKVLLNYIIVGGAVINFFAAPLSIFIPVFSKNILNGQSGSYGFLLSSLAVGGTAASVICALKGKKFNPFRMITLSLCFEGIFMCVFALSKNLIFSLISLFLLGSSFGFCSIYLSTVFQKLIPNKMMGRVSSLGNILCCISVPLGYFFGGIFADKYKVTNVILVYGILVFASALSTIRNIKVQQSADTPSF